MKTELIALLRCPKTGAGLRLVEGAPAAAAGEIIEGMLVNADGSEVYPVRGGIPRFVPASNYADNFGMQWNHFAQTQLDSHSGHPISAERFRQATGWDRPSLCGQWVLDVRAGSGRFAEVAQRRYRR